MYCVSVITFRSLYNHFDRFLRPSERWIVAINGDGLPFALLNRFEILFADVKFLVFFVHVGKCFP